MSKDNIYYVYQYLRACDGKTGKKGSPYYVGKGKGNRITGKHGGISVPKDPSCRVIIAKGLSENAAFKIEIIQIRLLGRIDLGNGILHNKNNGGGGNSGRKFTPAQREAQRLRNKEIFSRDEVRIKHKNSMRRVWSDPDYKAKIQEINQLPEVKQRRSNACKEAQNRLDVKAKKSKAMKKTASRPEYKESRKAVNQLPTVRENRSKAMKAKSARPGYLENRLAKLAATNKLPEVQAKRSAGAIRHNSKPENRDKQREVAKIVNALRKTTVPYEERLKQWYNGETSIYSIDSPGEGWTQGRPPVKKKECMYCRRLLGHSATHVKACSRAEL